ncbi:Phenylalanine--tRNA ligase, chloroplastic/mitochondrial [Galdieria sulphuraria]|nr:Phenylalanine--tRNA ligase, chloroplastic/mitochondrial [Galdieria sulphuraria]
MISSLLLSTKVSRATGLQTFLLPVVWNTSGKLFVFRKFSTLSFRVSVNGKTCQHFGRNRKRQLLLHCCLSSEAVVNLNLSEVPSSSNIPPAILEKTRERLHLRPNHPLHILKKMIENSIEDMHPREFSFFDDLPQLVSTKDCFDDLLVDWDHPSRRYTDTYYWDEHHVLRTHMTAHDTTLLRAGKTAFVLTGDVYRRDSIDKSHYPVFHQVDAVRIFDASASQSEDKIIADLKNTLESLAKNIFQREVTIRWVDGCGLLKRGVLDAGQVDKDSKGWAFGLGLERLAMVLFEIPDIRLFWSKDERFLQQFRDGTITKFKPYSKYPSCYKDVTFWLSDKFHENAFYELVRSIAGDTVEEVTLLDEFHRNNKTSHCYRIVYRSMDRSLTNDEVDEIQDKIREEVARRLEVILR